MYHHHRYFYITNRSIWRIICAMNIRFTRIGKLCMQIKAALPASHESLPVENSRNARAAASQRESWSRESRTCRSPNIPLSHSRSFYLYTSLESSDDNSLKSPHVWRGGNSQRRTRGSRFALVICMHVCMYIFHKVKHHQRARERRTYTTAPQYILYNDRVYRK